MKPREDQKHEDAKPDAGERTVIQPEPDAKGIEKKPEATVDAPPVPPTLTKRALCGEFVKTGKELTAARKRIDDERRALEFDRQSLERLKSRDWRRAHCAACGDRAGLEKLLAKKSDTPGEDTRCTQHGVAFNGPSPRRCVPRSSIRSRGR